LKPRFKELFYKNKNIYLNKMSNKICVGKIERKPGYMYYVDGKGRVCGSKMKNYSKIIRNKSRKSRK